MVVSDVVGVVEGRNWVCKYIYLDGIVFCQVLLVLVPMILNQKTNFLETWALRDPY